MLDRNQSHDVQRLSACESIARELLAKADGLVPVLRDRAPEAEALRRCPDATIRDFVDSGLLRACQPAAYGGHEMGYDVLCAIIQRLAQGCASQAWVYMVLADNPLKLATFSKQAQDDVWAGDATTRIGIAVAAVGVGKPVEGGVLWSGRHGFVSGIDHADWLICGGFVEDGGARRGCMVLMPKSEVEVIDDWHVVGLAGTGSKTFVAKDVFVPAHRMIDKKDYDAGTAPGAALYDAPIFRLPRGGVSAASYAAVALGAAQAMLQTFCEYTGPRKSRGKVVADETATQMTIGLASAGLEAGERLYMGALRETMETLEHGEKVSRHQQVQGKRNCCFAAQLAMQAAHRLFNSAGGRALFNDTVMQRQFRDCFAASAHHSLSWDGASAEYGRYALERYR